jgi:gluconolactonase
MSFQEVVEFIHSLNLKAKLSPRENVEIIWFYIFLPCFIGYLVILSHFLNYKPTIGFIETLDPTFDSLIYSSSRNIELIASGLQWSEGPIWVEDKSTSLSYLMFSDTITNRIYKWEEGKGLFTVGKTIFMENSGCISEAKTNETNGKDCSLLTEPGSNGLMRRSLDSLDLIICQHGERSVSLLRENGSLSVVASHYKGRRLNSPNDLALSPDGHLYFTDPPYGLAGAGEGGELSFSGVYLVPGPYLSNSLSLGVPTASVRLLDRSMARPNGLAFSPDYAKLYVSNSEKEAPLVKVFEVADNGDLVGGKVFFDMKGLLAEERGREGGDPSSVGSADGLKVDIHGNVFATGPGGVLVISPEGKLIGRFRLGNRPVNNLVFGEDGRLYFTAKDIVARAWIKTKPSRIIKNKK